jgi:hypothetical protein
VKHLRTRKEDSFFFYKVRNQEYWLQLRASEAKTKVNYFSQKFPINNKNQ